MGDYDDFDKKGSYTGGGGGFGAGNYLNDVYVTWDDTYLYVALAGAENDNKLALLIDVDPGNGTGATTTTNWTGNAASFISYNDLGWLALTNGFGLDFMVASEGFFNNVVQVLYDGVAAPDTNTVIALFDHGNGATPEGSPVDMAVYGDATTCALNGYEARIPWSVLYGSNTGRYGTVNGGEVVPAGAVIRLFANLHNNNPGIAYSSNDAIPEQVGGSWVDGLLTSDNYLDVPVDLDADGFPDLVPGDVNAPWIRSSAGLAGASNVYVQFNEPLNADTAVLLNSWQVGGSSPSAVTMITTSSVLLTLTNALPAAGTLVELLSADIEDNDGNARNNTACLVPVASGLTNILTVRFYLETSSGLGLNPGASNFFINGGSAPLQFGFPPATTAPLTLDSGTVYYRDVVFPPGTPTTLSYKYSGQLTTTGTNNYEAVRLANYDSASRVLTLDPGLTSMVVTDYLGAAAAPLRDTSTNANYNALFADAQRGDAGVRRRTTVKFQLDLSARDLSGITRVLIQGSDPLRGFNANDQLIPGDFAGSLSPAWLVGGVTLVDDGTLGDVTPSDGVYSRDWIFSVDGYDSVTEPGFPYSLVGGDEFADPYFGDSFWVARRSPRSVIYKFYVYKSGPSALESPVSNLELYLEDSAGTNVVLSPFVWANDGLLPPPPSNSPTMIGLRFTNGQPKVTFTNLPGEAAHGVEYAFDLKQGFREHGLRAVTNGGVWEGVLPGSAATAVAIRAYSGPAPARPTTWWTPNPVPGTGATVQVWFSQIGRENRGYPHMLLHSSLQADGSINDGSWQDHPMLFLGDGLWTASMAVNSLVATNKASIRFGFRNSEFSKWDGNWWTGGSENYHMIVGSRASWTPERPLPGGLLTVTYDATGGSLQDGTNVYIHSGYNKFEGTDWEVAYESPMTNIGGEVWTTTLQMRTNSLKTFNMLFRNLGDSVTWDSEYEPLHWVVFPGP